MRILGWLRGRVAAGLPVLRRVVLGAPAGAPASAPALPATLTAFFLMAARKLTVAIVGGIVAWLHVTLGWDLVSIFGDGFELALIEAITAYLVWRISNARAAPAAR